MGCLAQVGEIHGFVGVLLLIVLVARHIQVVEFGLPGTGW